MKAINSENVWIAEKQWKDLEMETVCPHIAEWHSDDFHLGLNKEPRILRAISHIDFNRLTRLIIYDNEIDSVECLRNIRMPEL